MTDQEKRELEGAVFYRHFQIFEGALKDCDDALVAFHIGRAVGMMQGALKAWPTVEEKGGAN